MISIIWRASPATIFDAHNLIDDAFRPADRIIEYLHQQLHHCFRGARLGGVRKLIMIVDFHVNAGPSVAYSKRWLNFRLDRSCRFGVNVFAIERRRVIGNTAIKRLMSHRQRQVPIGATNLALSKHLGLCSAVREVADGALCQTDPHHPERPAHGVCRPESRNSRLTESSKCP